MRICIIGKFPPIQGGVSMRTYWSAHALAARGHEVHVVTNAKEALPPFRMHMRPADWKRCEARYGAGSVTVHWTDPVDRSQSYIPMASPFVSKLAAIAARVHSERPFDVVFSHYLEPYGVAGHLAAQITGVPHVVRMAGSDAGRLWHHPQFEALYDHVLRSAEVVIAAGTVAERAIERGVDPERIAFGGGLVLPEDLFTPDGPQLDLETCGPRSNRIPTSAICCGGTSQPTGPISEFAESSARARDRSRCSRQCTGSSAPGWMSVSSRSRTASRQSKRSFARGCKNSASPTAFSKFRFFRTGACPNSCAAVSPCAASSRTSRSGSIRRSSRARCSFAGRAWLPRPRSSGSFPRMGVCPMATDASRSKM